MFTIMYAAISADIVSSTSLSKDAMIELTEKLKDILCLLEDRYEGFWGRIVRGDSIECIMPKAVDALEIAILLKAFVKSFTPKDGQGLKQFHKYGLRVAIGIGEMKTVDKTLDMLDGEAIYRSGRELDKLVGRSKFSFVLSMENTEKETALQLMVSLVNHLLNKATARKCQVLCERILAKDSNEVAQRMGISVSGVNQTLKDIGWELIEQVIDYYRKITTNI